MPRYFFHLDEHSGSPDQEGTVVADLATARTEALHYAGEIIAYANPTLVMQAEPFRVRVTDENGNEVIKLEIHDKAAPGACRVLQIAKGSAAVEISRHIPCGAIGRVGVRHAAMWIEIPRT